jgi:hypothetical protein
MRWALIGAKNTNPSPPYSQMLVPSLSWQIIGFHPGHRKVEKKGAQCTEFCRCRDLIKAAILNGTHFTTDVEKLEALRREAATRLR